MATSKAGKGENSLKAKLSKKVAELSTVVQVLFVRNHERELELMATKKAYEEEIRRVSEEGKSKLDWLESQLDQLERFRTLLDMKTEECERSKVTIETIQEKQFAAERKVNERGELLSEALSEIKGLKDIISAQSPEELAKVVREKEQLQTKLAEETSCLHEQEDLVNNLQIRVHTIESNLTNMVEQNDVLRNECSRLQEELTSATDEIGALSKSLTEARRHGERALHRSRKLEENNKSIVVEKTRLEKHNRHLNEEVEKLHREASSKKVESVVPERMPILERPTTPQKAKPRPVQDGEDVENLKKEIEKYRMELRNREINFNRVFADKTPMIIKKDAHSEDTRLRNLTGIVGYKKTLTSLPSVVTDTKPNYGYYPTRRKR